MSAAKPFSSHPLDSSGPRLDPRLPPWDRRPPAGHYPTTAPVTFATHLGAPSLPEENTCPFFLKTGACKYEELCNRHHPRPEVSKTILIPHMYLNLRARTLRDVHGQSYRYTESFLQQRMERFYEDVWLEASLLGEVEEMMMVKNTGEHLLGNVYLRFTTIQHATRAMKYMRGRSFEGRVLVPEYSPVQSFQEALCKLSEEGQCKFSENHTCNFLHVEQPGAELQERLIRTGSLHWRRKNRDTTRAENEGSDDGVLELPCFICGETGHIARKCPAARQQRETLAEAAAKES